MGTLGEDYPQYEYLKIQAFTPETADIERKTDSV